MNRNFRALIVAALVLAVAVVTAPLATSASGTPVPFTFESTVLPGQNPYVVALSADGQDAYLAESPGYLFASHDAGDTWTQLPLASEGWIAIATSSNGEIVYAVTYGGQIQKSTNSGVTWSTTTSGTKNWNSLATSADGVYVYAGIDYADPYDGVYRSADSGATWSKTTLPNHISHGISVSDDGAIVYAAISGDNNPLRVSTDYGVTWRNARTPFAEWIVDSVAVTPDGSTVIAAVGGDRSSGPGGSCCSGVWKSTDTGQNWTRIFYPETYNNYPQVSISADGSVITVGTHAPNNGVFISQDSGATWTNSISGIDSHAVVSRDGAVVMATDSVSKVYTIPGALGTTASLSSLVVLAGGLTPEFSADVTEYTVTGFSPTADSISIMASPTDPNATVTINSTTLTSGQWTSVPLSQHQGRIAISVTAQDGMASRLYFLTIPAPSSSNATLSRLRISQGTLSPAFKKSITTYTASVGNDVKSVNVTAKTSDEGCTNECATVKIEGRSARAELTKAVALSVGTHRIPVVVTAEDGTTKKIYTITVTRAPSSVATLRYLRISAGTLSPAFATSKNAYAVSVAKTVSSIKITATVTEANATLVIGGKEATSGSPSTVNMAPGLNKIRVVVTAEDGTTRETYTVAVTRGQ